MRYKPNSLIDARMDRVACRSCTHLKNDVHYQRLFVRLVTVFHVADTLTENFKFHVTRHKAQCATKQGQDTKRLLRSSKASRNLLLNRARPYIGNMEIDGHTQAALLAN